MTQVKAVSSRDNPLLVRLRKLVGDPGGYRKAGEVWIEGDHLCSALLEQDRPCTGSALRHRADSA